MAVAIAHTGQAIALDTKSLEYEVINIPENIHMAVVHSGEHRNLSDGRYAVRKEECDKAKQLLDVLDLCLLDDEGLEKAQSLPSPLTRRVRHCVSEHHRTIASAKALGENDMKSFGELINESHISMRCVDVEKLDAWKNKLLSAHKKAWFVC